MGWDDGMDMVRAFKRRKSAGLTHEDSQDNEGYPN